MVDVKRIEPYLDGALDDIEIAELPNHSRGKVRDNYDLPDGRRIIAASDRLSAFDRILTTIPLKGQALTQIARFWFDATADLCPNHIEVYPDPNVAVCRRLTIMPVEIVVRGYLAGTTGTSILPPRVSKKLISACGTPVELPIANTCGATSPLRLKRIAGADGTTAPRRSTALDADFSVLLDEVRASAPSILTLAISS